MIDKRCEYDKYKEKQKQNGIVIRRDIISTASKYIVQWKWSENVTSSAFRKIEKTKRAQVSTR